MHLLLLIIAFTVACTVRLVSKSRMINPPKKWGLSLFFFGFPPLILLTTCLTVAFMGSQGQMWGIKASRLSYYFAVLYLVMAIAVLIKSFWDLSQLQRTVEQYPTQIIDNQPAQILDSSFPYAAQVGFWRSQLVISTGLQKLLSPEHLNAVIAHETAHKTHKDPFFFFWLSYLERVTFWLPNNQQLWRHLLLLRELRADQTAAEKVDFLLIAESLVSVTSETVKQKESLNLAWQCPFNDDRLEERINNLLEEDNQLKFGWGQIVWFVLVLIPYSFLPFHISC